MVDKNNETTEVLFSGEMIKYTIVFKKVKRSDSGTGSNIQQKLLDYRSDLVYIPKANECFTKSIESRYRKDFSRENREFVKQSDRGKNIITQAKVQPFFEKYKLNLIVCNTK